MRFLPAALQPRLLSVRLDARSEESSSKTRSRQQSLVFCLAMQCPGKDPLLVEKSHRLNKRQRCRSDQSGGAAPWPGSPWTPCQTQCPFLCTPAGGKAKPPTTSHACKSMQAKTRMVHEQASHITRVPWGFALLLKPTTRQGRMTSNLHRVCRDDFCIENASKSY